MMREHTFIVADLSFTVKMPESWNVRQILPSFIAFSYKEKHIAEKLFCITVCEEKAMAQEECRSIVCESENDMGYVQVLETEKGYRIKISYDKFHENFHTMDCSRGFDSATANIRYHDPEASVALTSMLRMLFAQTALRHQAISIHASCIHKDGLGYLFLGKSGTGKSTHARQWLRAFPDSAYLLNDDNPIIKIENGNVYVYGSPWSGKTHCYKQERYPIRGIVKLNQAKHNRVKLLEDVNAFVAILPSCSVYRNDRELQDLLYRIIIKICQCVKTAICDCLPDINSAKLCYAKINDVD